MKTTDAKFKNQWAINTSPTAPPNSVMGGQQVVSNQIQTPKTLLLDAIKQWALNKPIHAIKLFNPPLPKNYTVNDVSDSVINMIKSHMLKNHTVYLEKAAVAVYVSNY